MSAVTVQTTLCYFSWIGSEPLAIEAAWNKHYAGRARERPASARYPVELRAQITITAVIPITVARKA